jgi:hypothetical protein
MLIENNRSVNRTRSKANIKYYVLMMSLIGLALVSSSTNNRISTIYDGVTREKYVSYLKMNGSNGASVNIPDS